MSDCQVSSGHNQSQRTPGGYHVKVEQGRKSAVECGSRLQGLDPQVEGCHKEEDGDGLVVI